MVQMSVAEARRAGLIGDVTKTGKPRKKKTTRKQAARDGAKTKCHDCDEVFTRDIDEERHMDSAKHHRFETVDLSTTRPKKQKKDADE